VELSHILAFNAALLAAWIAPGPAMLYALRTSLAYGRAAGIAAGVGLGAVACLWTLAALLGLDALFAMFPWAYTVLKVGGSLYLIWIAVQTWRSAGAPVGTEGPDTVRRLVRAAARGALLNIGNPKSVLFAAAVLAVIFPPGLTAGEMAFVTLNHFGLEVALYGMLAAVVSTPAVSRRYLALKLWLDRVSAAVMGGLGLRLLLDR
jgi:threonine/homoserine/homoserine lactone efflux protein